MNLHVSHTLNPQHIYAVRSTDRSIPISRATPTESQRLRIPCHQPVGTYATSPACCTHCNGGTSSVGKTLSILQRSKRIHETARQHIHGALILSMREQARLVALHAHTSRRDTETYQSDIDGCSFPLSACGGSRNHRFAP